MPEDVERLKSAVSIVDVVRRYMDLQPSGREFLGLCPFHSERTPSFRVYPGGDGERPHWTCYGACGTSGDVLEFLQRIEDTDFPGALAILKQITGRTAPAPVAPDPPRPKPAVPPSHLVATYHYTDAQGTLLFDTERWEPGRDGRKKDFRQCRYEGGRKVYDLNGVQRVLYNLPAVSAATEIWLCEGEKDADRLIAYGLTGTTAPMGAGAKWLPQYTDALAGKTVYVLPDNDEPGRKHAQKILSALRAVCHVKLIELPGLPEHGDVSDWLDAGHSDLDLRALVHGTEAVLAEPEPEAEDPQPERKLAANELAKLILARNDLIRNREGYQYRYNGWHWEAVTTAQLRNMALRAESDRWTTMKRRGEVVSFIQDSIVVGDIQWRSLDPNEIPFRNGVLNVLTGDLRAHRKEDYLETVIPHEYEPTATCPAWDAALQLYFGDDRDYQAKCDALRMFIGYCLLPHARYKKALLLTGEGDTGKSQIPFVIREIVGDANCCAVSVEQMDDPRLRVPLMGKMVNLLTELTSKAAIADGGFKTLISTEEPLQFDPKYEQPLMYRPFAKHIIACNELPVINDRSRATYNRLLLLRFNQIIPAERRDRNIMDKFRAEIRGILTWAVSGAYDLIRAGGEFEPVQESLEAVTEYREEQNPMFLFIEENCIACEDAMIGAKEFREKYQAWLPGGSKEKSPSAVGRAAAAAGYKIQPRYNPALGKTERCVLGLRWKSIGD